MSSPKAISRWTALVAKQVKKHKYCFCLRDLLPWIVTKGPPKSTAVCAKSRSDNQSLINGMGAIICFGKLHSSHSRISSCPDIIQNRVDRTASVWFAPLAWFPSLWKYFTINFVTWCMWGRIIGKRASWDKNSAYLSWLSHLIWPSSSNHGPKASNLLSSVAPFGVEGPNTLQERRLAGRF